MSSLLKNAKYIYIETKKSADGSRDTDAFRAIIYHLKQRALSSNLQPKLPNFQPDAAAS